MAGLQDIDDDVLSSRPDTSRLPFDQFPLTDRVAANCQRTVATGELYDPMVVGALERDTVQDRVTRVRSGCGYSDPVSGKYDHSSLFALKLSRLEDGGANPKSVEAAIQIKAASKGDVVRYADLELDLKQHKVKRNDRTIKFGPTEFRLLSVF